MITRIMVLTVIVVSLTACNQNSSSTDITPAALSIAVSKTPLSAPFFIAEEKGFFAKHGVSVNLLMRNSGHHCLAMVLKGEADMGTASDYPIMIQSFQRNDYAIAATFVSSGNDVKLIANKMSVTQARDLKGKRIGTVIGASSHFFLERFLLFNNLTLADVNVVQIKPENMPQALKEGVVDALSAWEPYGYLSHKLPGDNTLIFPSKNYYRETFNLVLSKKYIHDNPKLVERSLRALNEAIEFIHQQPEKAQQIVIKRLKLDNAFISWVWQDLNFQLSLDQSLLKTLESEAEWAIQNKLIKNAKEIDYTSYLYLDALTRVDSSMVTVIH